MLGLDRYKDDLKTDKEKIQMIKWVLNLQTYKTLDIYLE